MMCDNVARNSKSNFGHGIGVMQCYDNEAKYKVKISYTGTDKDKILLCDKCKKYLIKDIKGRNYRFESKKII